MMYVLFLSILNKADGIAREGGQAIGTQEPRPQLVGEVEQYKRVRGKLVRRE